MGRARCEVISVLRLETKASIWRCISAIFSRIFKISCKKFLELGLIVFDLSIDDNKALKYSCENGYLEFVKLLLKDKRTNPSNSNNYAIRYARHSGHLEIVKLLLQDIRVNPSDDNNSAIILACHNGWL